MSIPSAGIDRMAEELFEKIRLYSPEIDIKKLHSAFDFAKLAHEGQMRRSGEPYIVHPIRTVEILAKLHVDEDTIIAGFLHDVPEDTRYSITAIERQFGQKIAYLVEGITKLSKVYYQERMEQRQIESLKKLFIHTAQDLRVIIIKLADRLDNMRTLKYIADEKKRMRIAKETMEIYVPIANLLGIGEIRSELEDLCFEHILPNEYLRLKGEVEENMTERSDTLEEMLRITEREFRKNKIEAEIVGRPKTLHSIYQKLQTKQSIYNIDDLIAIRVIVPTRKDCYQALGIIHHLFKPKNGRMKDYIAVPKSNGYQSLHTSIFGLNGTIVEFQIRTKYMHLEAEYGIAAHYFYKFADVEELTNMMQQRSSWVQRILEMQKDNIDPNNFMENLKLDVFQDRIFVFSPKGDVIDLPREATAIDYAFAIHTDIGNHAIKAEINKIIVPITTNISTGDIVNIITNKSSHPEREWLNFAKTALAIQKIKEHLKNEPLDKKIAVGKKLLQKEFDRIGKSANLSLTGKNIKMIFDRLKYKTLEEILIAIGDGDLDPREIIEILFENKSFTHEIINPFASKKRKNPDFRSRIGLRIIGDNSKNQFKEITRILNALQIPIVKFIIDKPFYLNHHRCRLSILVKNYDELSQVFESIEQIDGIKEIRRLFRRRKFLFLFYALFTAVLWLSQPFLIHDVLENRANMKSLEPIIIYSGLIMLFVLVFYLKRMTRRSFPELAETAYYWPLLYAITTFALFTTIGEIMYFQLKYNNAFVLGLIIGVYALITASYISYKREQFTR